MPELTLSAALDPTPEAIAVFTVKSVPPVTVRLLVPWNSLSVSDGVDATTLFSANALPFRFHVTVPCRTLARSLDTKLPNVTV